jgi:hypothetical protein
MPAKAAIAGRLPVRRGLDENEAAVYPSLSPTFFRKLVEDKRMPRPRRVWDMDELDLAFKALPREGGEGICTRRSSPSTARWVVPPSTRS